jgi:hypothetical protein
MRSLGLLVFPIGDLRLGYLSGKHVAAMRDEMLDEGFVAKHCQKVYGLVAEGY